MTPFPEEWAELEVLANCLGIWPAYHSSARHFLSQLVSWAEVLPGTRQVVILLVDGLDLLTTDGFHDQHVLRWLLTYGTRRHVWPVITINPGRLLHLETWLDYFRRVSLGGLNVPKLLNFWCPTRKLIWQNWLKVGNMVFGDRIVGLNFNYPTAHSKKL